MSCNWTPNSYAACNLAQLHTCIAHQGADCCRHCDARTSPLGSQHHLHLLPEELSAGGPAQTERLSGSDAGCHMCRYSAQTGRPEGSTTASETDQEDTATSVHAYIIQLKSAGLVCNTVLSRKIRHWDAYDVPASAYEHAIRLHGCLDEMHILPAEKSVTSFAMALQGRADACMARVQGDGHICRLCVNKSSSQKA